MTSLNPRCAGAGRPRGGCLSAAARGTALRSEERRRELDELVGIVAASATIARQQAIAELAELRRHQSSQPSGAGAVEAWTLRCWRQSVRYYDAVEQADSLEDELVAVRAQIDAIAARHAR